MSERERRESVALAYAGLVQAIGNLGTLTVDVSELDAFGKLLQAALDAVNENRERLIGQMH